MRRLVALTLLTLSACGGSSSDLPEQAPAAVAAAFGDVITACARPLNDAGGIDQRALAAAGWAVTSRTTRFETTNTSHALTDYPTLRAGAYEATEWRHAGHVGEMELIRFDVASEYRAYDHCRLIGRVANDAEIAAIVSALTRRMGHAPDRRGTVSPGGDGLTPRIFSDPDDNGYYWALPKHDVYLQTSADDFANIDVVAMPDRAALDRYSSDRPERRLYNPGEPPQ